MMKKLISILFIISIVFYSCNKLSIDKDTPKCIKKRIEEFYSESCEKGAEVKEYVFQNQTVFTFNSGNCHPDEGLLVVDSDCNNLGILGGFSGGTKIQGVSFFQNAVYVKTVWKK